MPEMPKSRKRSLPELRRSTLRPAALRTRSRAVASMALILGLLLVLTVAVLAGMSLAAPSGVPVAKVTKHICKKGRGHHKRIVRCKNHKKKKHPGPPAVPPVPVVPGGGGQPAGNSGGTPTETPVPVSSVPPAEPPADPGPQLPPGQGPGGEPVGTPGSEFERVDLIGDNGFEGDHEPTDCFVPNQDVGQPPDGAVGIDTTSPIAGDQSLATTISPFGRVGCFHQYGFDSGPIVRLVKVEGDLRIDAPTSGEGLKVCAIVYYEENPTPQGECKILPTADRGVVHVVQTIEMNNQRLQRVFFQLEAGGKEIQAALDEAHLIVEQVKGSEGPRGVGGGGGGGGGGGACAKAIEGAEEPVPNGPPDPNSPCDLNEKPKADSGYTPGTLNLPTQRPFISLADYNAVSESSPIYKKFKEWVDQNVFDNDPGYEYSSIDAAIMYARTHNPAYIEDAISRVDAGVRDAEASVSRTGSFEIDAEYESDAGQADSSGKGEVVVEANRALRVPAATSSPATAGATTTEVHCGRSSLQPGETTTCEAVVKEAGAGATAPTGIVVFSSPQGGSFEPSQCSLSSAGGSTSTCEVHFAPAEAPQIAEDSYLHSGGEMEELALVYDYGLASGKLSANQEARWKAYGDQVIANIWNPLTATWGGYPAGTFPWSAWAINDPGNNYNFSFIKATQMWALATHNMAWIEFLRQYKFPLMVDYYSQLKGGGSREGTGYGSSQRELWENARMWKGSTGEALTAIEKHARESIEYWVNATVPTLNYFAPIGDLSRQSLPELFDYQENLVREAAMAAPGTAEAAHGLWWLNHNSVPETLTQGFTLRGALLTPEATAAEPTALSYHATGVGQVFARSSWEKDATWMQFTGGPYDQSHAHEDQGAFTLYRGTWLTVTSNIWSQSGLQGGGGGGRVPDLGTGVNNVIRFDKPGQGGSSQPIRQNFSESTVAVEELAGNAITIHANLSNAYSDNSDLVHSWMRELQFKNNELLVHDVCSVAPQVTPVFQLNVPVRPVDHGDGVITAGNLRVEAPASVQVNFVEMNSFVAPFVNEETGVEEEDHEFEKGWRIDLTKPGCEFTVSLQALS